MLEVGRVVHARRQQHDRGVVNALGRNRAQVFQQQVRVVGDRCDLVAGEEIGEQPHHHLAVFQHVADAAGHPQVVLEHVEHALTVRVAGAHQIDAGDVRVDAALHIDAFHLAPVLRVLQHLLGRDAAGAQDLSVVIDVMQEQVERLDPLAQAVFELAPFGGGNDARDHVERDQPLGAGAVVLVAVDREGDTDAPEHQVGLGALVGHGLLGLRTQPGGEVTIRGANLAVAAVHLVECCHRQAPRRTAPALILGMLPVVGRIVPECGRRPCIGTRLGASANRTGLNYAMAMPEAGRWQRASERRAGKRERAGAASGIPSFSRPRCVARGQPGRKTSLLASSTG